MRTTALISIAAVAALLTSVTGAASSRATDRMTASAAADAGHQRGACDPSWRLVAAPPAPGATVPVSQGTSDHIVSVSAISGDDARFTGYTSTISGYGQPWTLAWNGRSVTAAAQAAQQPLSLSGFDDLTYDPASFDSAADGWMLDDPRVASTYIDPDTSTAEHWHDGRWTLTPMAVSPDVAAKGIWLQAVDAVSSSDAWAAGGLYAVGPGNLFGASPVGALLEHWDGSAWNIIPNPADSQAGAVLNGLNARSPDDVWAVGQQGGGASVTPLLEHWNGTAWQAVPAPAGSQPSWLQAVSATAADDAWAVGYQAAPGSTSSYVPLVEHWDGSAWSIVALPGGASLSGLVGVYAASASDVWATFGGSQFAEGAAAGGTSQAFLHWDGSRWTTVAEPGPQEYGTSYAYNSISGTGPDDVWAAGQANLGYPPSTAVPVIAHLSCG
jgi:hypothetical protein